MVKVEKKTLLMAINFGHRYSAMNQLHETTGRVLFYISTAFTMYFYTLMVINEE